MLVESTTVRDFLSTTVEILPTRNDLDPADAQSLRASPKTYNFSMNPIPALIILLLGIMMSSHQQGSMVGTMVHKQWGTLFVGFALARAVTYVLFFISPPTSLFGSRPPSELVSSFCLVSGGLIFMASVSQQVQSHARVARSLHLLGWGPNTLHDRLRPDGNVPLHRLYGTYRIHHGVDYHRTGDSRLVGTTTDSKSSPILMTERGVPYHILHA